MSQRTLEPVTVVIQPPPTFTVTVVESKILPAVTVQVPGIQGPAAADKPLDIDPLELYLKAKNGNSQ